MTDKTNFEMTFRTACPTRQGQIPSSNQTGGTGVSPMQAQAKACGYQMSNSV
jgi:hypothetical protein